MTKTVLSICIALATGLAAAGDQEVVLESSLRVVEYTASVSGPAGCKPPVDIAAPKEGDCVVRKDKLETGWKLVKVGGSCYLNGIKLIRWQRVRAMGADVDLPEIENRRKKVTCPV